MSNFNGLKTFNNVFSQITEMKTLKWSFNRIMSHLKSLKRDKNKITSSSQFSYESKIALLKGYLNKTIKK